MASIGVIGTGIISSAIVTGFCDASLGDLEDPFEYDFDDHKHRIIVSPRNAVRAANLASNFSNVTVARDNQEVLDRSEWVLLSVLPEVGPGLIKELKFRSEHKVVNLMSTIRLRDIASAIGQTALLVHMVPLPFIAQRIGPILTYPQSREVYELFSPLGEIVAVDNEKQAIVMQTITALMSPYYKLLSEITDWGVSEGLDYETARGYTSVFFTALSQRAGFSHTDLAVLSREYTPGGLNEATLKKLEGDAVFDRFAEALDMILKRVRG